MKLLEKMKLGSHTLQNAMAMAPMTRSRANLAGEVSDSTVLYYVQRASAGLLITEAVNISEDAIGSPFTPGLYTNAQVAAWQKVTKAVHEKGGKIFAQLWHTGRVGHSLVRNGKLPFAPSAVGIQGQQHFTAQGMMDYETPQALTNEQVKTTIQDYRKAAINAKLAGFDGVELHAAFGYLPNQFLVESANLRTDEYGGSIGNRCRFVLEVMKELSDVFGADGTGIKLSPSIPYNSMIDSNPTALFSHLIEKLNDLPLSYLHLMNAMFPLDALPHYPKDVLGTFAKYSKHLIMANGGYNRETGEQVLESGVVKMVSYGSLFLANPDLPRRFELNVPLNQADKATMYGGGDKGYIDYPALEA